MSVSWTVRASPIFIAACLAACAPTYDYAFAVAPPAARTDVETDVRVAPEAGAIELALHNQTDQVLQVEWTNIALTRPDGNVTLLRPDTDVGWIAPGARVAARLFPLALPRKGDDALANDGARWTLDIPLVVRREPRTVRVTLSAHVFKVKK